jgi:hypothetical protein
MSNPPHQTHPYLHALAKAGKLALRIKQPDHVSIEIDLPRRDWADSPRDVQTYFATGVGRIQPKTLELADRLEKQLAAAAKPDPDRSARCFYLPFS